MRKYLYQITVSMYPVYFAALAIAIVIFVFFFGATKGHAQTNHADFHSVLASVPLDHITSVRTTLDEQKILIPDEIAPKIEMDVYPADQYVDVHVNRTITNIIVFDDHNQVMEDIAINMDNHHIDTSSLCPGVYYIRVDYTNGSCLRPLIIP